MLTSDTIHGFSQAILAARYDEPKPIPQFHREFWDLCCTDAPQVAIAAPRGHAKSTAGTFAYALALLMFRQENHILVVSSNEELASAFDLPEVGAALLDESGKSLTVVAECISEDRPSALGVVLPVQGYPSAEYVIVYKAPLAIADAQHDPFMESVHDLMRERGVASLLILPLTVRGEVEGTIGEAPEAITVLDPVDQIDTLDILADSRIAYLTQTTLAIDEVDDAVRRLRRRFPRLVGPRRQDICYATSNRQRAVREIAGAADLVLVIGSGNSSNSRRLVEIAEREGCAARLIDDETGLDPTWLRDRATIGVTAGASAPQGLVDRVVESLASLGRIDVEERRAGAEELRFSLPPELDQTDRRT